MIRSSKLVSYILCPNFLKFVDPDHFLPPRILTVVKFNNHQTTNALFSPVLLLQIFFLLCWFSHSFTTQFMYFCDGFRAQYWLQTWPGSRWRQWQDSHWLWRQMDLKWNVNEQICSGCLRHLLTLRLQFCPKQNEVKQLWVNDFYFDMRTVMGG